MRDPVYDPALPPGVELRQGQALLKAPGDPEPRKQQTWIFWHPDDASVFGYVFLGNTGQPLETKPGVMRQAWYVDIEDGEGAKETLNRDNGVVEGAARCRKRDAQREQVRTRKVWPYSPSQVNKYDDCPRLWAWDYPEGFRAPSKASAAWGTEAHRQAENWFRYATPPDLSTPQGRAVAKSLPMLPTPGAHLEVEKDFRFEEDGLVFRGQVDLEYLSEDGPYIIDHKTTADFSWALTEESLRHDTQAVIYAKAAMDRFGTDSVTLHWNYMLRTSSKPRSKQVKVKVTREEIEAAFEEVKEKAKEIEQVRKAGIRAFDLPIVADSCGKYGGCPHQERCRLTAVERMSAIMKQQGKKMNLKEKMKARQAAKAAAGGAAPTTPAAAPAAAPAAPAPVAAAAPAAAPVAPQPAAPAPQPAQTAGHLMAVQQPPVNPPAAPAPAPAAVAQPAPAAQRAPASAGRMAVEPTPHTSVHLPNGISDQEAFVRIYGQAVLGGDARHMAAADQVWAKFKQTFG